MNVIDEKFRMVVSLGTLYGVFVCLRDGDVMHYITFGEIEVMV